MKITFVVTQPAAGGSEWTSMANRTADFSCCRWHRLGRITGVAGLAAVVLILVPVVVGTRPEPSTPPQPRSSPITDHPRR